MAQRRCINKLIRHSSSLLTSAKPPFPKPSSHHLLHQNLAASPLPIHPSRPTSRPHYYSSVTRHFTKKSRDDTDEEDPDDGVEEETSDEDDDNEDDGGEIDNENVTNCAVSRVYSAEEKAIEAAEIGYKVVGPLLRSDRVFKDYEPAFAVVQIGSHQFKVSNGDCIYTEKLKFCEVNDKIMLNKVLLLGTSAQTIVGRPILLDAAVHAVVEEHALDAKVIIFKKKRRKNYRRTKGHRQELTKLRITSIEGIVIPQKPVSVKPEKTTSVKTGKKVLEKLEKVPVAA